MKPIGVLNHFQTSVTKSKIANKISVKTITYWIETNFIVFDFVLYFRNMFYDMSNWVIETAFATMLYIQNFILWCVLAAWEGTLLSTLTAYYVTESIIYNITPWFLRSRKSLKGKVVVITGGAGGLGQELALRLARIKARVVVWDNNEKGLKLIWSCYDFVFHCPDLSTS